MAKIGGGIVAILISLMVMLFIGIVVVQALITSANTTGWDAAAVSAWNALKSNTWVAFTLLAIIPIVVGAVAIIGYLRFGGA